MKMPTLIVMAAALLMAAASPPEKGGSPRKDQQEASARKVKELQKERIATLEKLVDQLTKLARAGRVEFAEAMEARRRLLQAELDAAEKGADRISLYKKALDSLAKYEQLANVRWQAGRATETTVLKIKARRLEVEIQLERAKAKAKDPTK